MRDWMDEYDFVLDDMIISWMIAQESQPIATKRFYRSDYLASIPWGKVVKITIEIEDE